MTEAVTFEEFKDTLLTRWGQRLSSTDVHKELKRERISKREERTLAPLEIGSRYIGNKGRLPMTDNTLLNAFIDLLEPSSVEDKEELGTWLNKQSAGSVDLDKLMKKAEELALNKYKGRDKERPKERRKGRSWWNNQAST